MATIPESARAVLEGPALAHLVTLEPDGRPQVSIVWIGPDGEEVVAAHLPEHRKVRRDPRVALSIEAGTRNEIGLDEYIVIHGSARITSVSGLLASISDRMSSSRQWITRPPGTSLTSLLSGSAV